MSDFCPQVPIVSTQSELKLPDDSAKAKAGKSLVWNVIVVLAVVVTTLYVVWVVLRPVNAFLNQNFS